MLSFYDFQKQSIVLYIPKDWRDHWFKKAKEFGYTIFEDTQRAYKDMFLINPDPTGPFNEPSNEYTVVVILTGKEDPKDVFNKLKSARSPHTS